MMEKVLAKAKKRCDQAEIFQETSSSLLTRSSLDRIEACTSSSDNGYALRVVKGGRLGHSFFKREADADRAISEAIKSARLSHRENQSLPGKSRYKELRHFDKKLESASIESLVDMLLESMDATAEHAEPIKAEVRSDVSEVRIANTEGVDAVMKDSLFTVFCVGKKSESMGDDFFTSKRLRKKSREVGESAGLLSEMGAGAKPVDYEGTITLHQDVLSSFFSACILQNLNGEAARRGKSKWAGMLGKKVTGEYSIIDDPTTDWGVGTAPFDDEGVPTRRKILVRRGVLRQLCYDGRSANLSNAKSTGNGFRNGYQSPPSIGFTNLVVEPHRLSSPREGMFVQGLMGYHNMNTVSGDFSLDITLGMLGDSPVRGCVLTGNLFDILESGEWTGPSLTRDWFTSPRLSFEGRVVAK